eukprot:1143217-Pleurochrysis_carterae.AAC.1
MRDRAEYESKSVGAERTDNVLPCFAATVTGDGDVIGESRGEAQKTKIEHAQVRVVVLVVIVLSVFGPGVGLGRVEIRKPVENACKYVGDQD